MPNSETLLVCVISNYRYNENMAEIRIKKSKKAHTDQLGRSIPKRPIYLFREKREGMGRENKDITYFKAFYHYLMFYFMTNPSERPKRSLIQSYNSLLYFKFNFLLLLSSIPQLVPRWGKIRID